MSKLEKNIENAISLINNQDIKNNSLFTSIYPFTTENIKGYLDLLDIENKDVLTVGASADHILNLLLRNPKSIDYFDINPFTSYYVDLKITSKNYLKRKDYFKYFCNIYPNSYNEDKFNINLYDKFRNNLENDSKIFWDSLYSYYDGIKIRDSKLFSKDEYNYKILNSINNYLSKANYSKLSKIEKKEHIFYESDLSNLKDKLDKKYDLIMLSNIGQYYYNEFDEFKNIIFNLEEKLKDNGIILICYLYDINIIYNPKTMPAIYNIDKVLEEYKNIDISVFDSITSLKYHHQKETKDAVLVYKKTK